MRDILEPLGLVVLEAGDGPACLDLAAAHPPDLFLLDISMPGMSGWALAKALRAAGHTARIAMMSANVHEISEGIVYTDARVSIRAFAVPHAGWKSAFGYRIQTPDKLIVISGDARANPAIARECAGCDILSHEVYSDAGFATKTSAVAC